MTAEDPNGDETDRERHPPLRDRLGNAAFLSAIWLAQLLPYRRRLPVAGWFFAHILAPLAGWRRRIRANLALVRPDLSRAEVEHLVRAVPDNIGRSMVETYSGDSFIEHTRATGLIEGPGLPLLEAAFAEPARHPRLRPYRELRRHARVDGGARLAGRWVLSPDEQCRLQPPLHRRDHPYLGTAFPRGRRGLSAMLRHLREGGWLAIAIDQADRHADTLMFFGQPAHTSLTAAELALRHDALLLQAAAIRQPDGLTFKVWIDEPIPHGEAPAMMQELNDRLEALIRQHMGQWLWIHRRWK